MTQAEFDKLYLEWKERNKVDGKNAYFSLIYKCDEVNFLKKILREVIIENESLRMKLEAKEHIEDPDYYRSWGGF